MRARDALQQAFMSRDEYESLPVGEKIWDSLARPVLLWGTIIVGTVVVIVAGVITGIVFDIIGDDMPFCREKRLSPLPDSSLVEPGRSRSAYMLTEEEAAVYFWIVVFIPTAILFSVAVIYLIAGIAVAYAAPRRHPLLKVVENSCCASKRGGVRCLSILNIVFMIAFIFMALFLGSSIVTLNTGCSLVLFWCYEALCWGLVFLFGNTAFFLHRKAAVVMDQGEHYGSRTIGMELLEADVAEVERRVNQGFKKWMGSSVLSSDDEDDTTFGLDDDVWDEEAAHIRGTG